MLPAAKFDPPKSLAKLSATTQALCNKVYISRAPGVFMFLARILMKIAGALVSVHTYKGPYPAFAKDSMIRDSMTSGELQPADVLPFSPYVGPCNPISPAFQFTIEEPGERVTGIMIAPTTFAGPPNVVHGGMVAGVFDDLLGTVNWTGKNSGFTGTLTVRYLRHTPILKPVQLKAECVKREGRKTWISGEMSYEGEVTATAEAIFVQPKSHSLPAKD